MAVDPRRPTVDDPTAGHEPLPVDIKTPAGRVTRAPRSVTLACAGCGTASVWPRAVAGKVRCTSCGGRCTPK